MSPQLKLIVIGLRHLADESNPSQRADILDAGASLLRASAGVTEELVTIADQASLTASMIRRTEEMQGAFHNLLIDG